MTEARKYWLDRMLDIADPVLHALAGSELKQKMPVYHHPETLDRPMFTYLEAVGRTLLGLAPWLEHPALDPVEDQLREEYGALARKGLTNAVDPANPDFLNFSEGMQPIVDAAFLAEAMLRAPHALYEKLSDEAKQNMIAAMRSTRTRKPAACNWLLFGGTIEAFLHMAGAPDWDPMRIDYALRQHEQWYKGDGVYGDACHFHADYYNSFVIQPMILDILKEVEGIYPDWDAMKPEMVRRASHFAGLLEQVIAPDGSWPVMGRSVAYRFGAFQSLAQAALEHNLEEGFSPAQVRCALTAAIRRTLAFPSVFDKEGWLTIGVAGQQPGMGDEYISTGSLYLCSAVFLPLGLPESDPFWMDEDAPWTQKRIWAGDDAVTVRHFRD